ncbi:MAG TPA: histidine kinase [Trueperaceae bacterium]|nr:histidine kinase [Trueperaceae bacterium]
MVDPNETQRAVPWHQRLSTRLTLLLLAVVAVLTVAMGVLLWRALAEVVRLRTGVDMEPGLGGLEALAGQDAIDAQAAAAVLRSTLVNLIVVVAVTLLAATAFSRSLLADPISRLTETTRALAAGDLQARTDVQDSSEIGELARSFDTMAEALSSAQDRLEARVTARTAELRALLELSNTIAITVDLEPQLEAVLARLLETGTATAAEVLVIEPDGRLKTVASSGNVPPSGVAPVGEDPERPAGKGIARAAVVDRDEAALPLRARDQVVGVLHAYAPPGRGWDEEQLELAAGLAAQAAVAIENARLYERARGQAADEERRNLARELHDSVSQAIYAVVLSGHAARRRLTDDARGAAEALDSVIELAEGALAEMRALIFELRPEELAEVGLVGAMRRQLDGLELRHGIATAATFAEEPDLPFATKREVLRVVQEALHNVAKHARPTRVTAGLEVEGDCVVVTVEDDGIGFDPEIAHPGHLGLTSMHERVAAVGGRLQVRSSIGEGTTVIVRIPLEGGE